MEKRARRQRSPITPAQAPRPALRISKKTRPKNGDREGGPGNSAPRRPTSDQCARALGGRPRPGAGHSGLFFLQLVVLKKRDTFPQYLSMAMPNLTHLTKAKSSFLSCKKVSQSVSFTQSVASDYEPQTCSNFPNFGLW